MTPPPQLANLDSMSFDGRSHTYEGVEIAAEDDDHGGYNLHALGRGRAWITNVMTRTKTCAMFTSFVRGDHRGWEPLDDEGPRDPAALTKGSGPASAGTHLWVAETLVYGWFDAPNDDAAMTEARLLCATYFDIMRALSMRFTVYHSNNTLVGEFELRSGNEDPSAPNAL